MAFQQIRMDRPLSRIELAIAVILIALCFTWFLNRMNYLAAVAEATALDLTVRNVRSGIMGIVAGQILKHDYDALAAMAEGNPVGIAISPPAGYIGSLHGANPENILPGQWYFDEDNGWLAYHVVNTDFFLHEGEGPSRVRMQLRLNYDDVDGDGALESAVDRVTGVSLVLLDDLNWKF